jgi:uncharacterized protein YbjQ (UPF0145 family)/DNA-directed RNA polymerase subunit RPC12/RpoP
MANICSRCGKKLSIIGTHAVNGQIFCKECINVIEEERELIKKQQEKEMEERKRIEDEAISKILVVTVPSIEDRKVLKYFDAISKEYFIGTGLLSELSASFDDITGSISDPYSYKLEKIKTLAFDNLKRKAFRLGANAIIGAEVEYMITNHNMLMFSVIGTPVLIED